MASPLSRKKIHSTVDLIEWIKQTDIRQPVMITTHPQRWTNHVGDWVKEYVLQSCKNVVKMLMVSCKKK